MRFEVESAFRKRSSFVLRFFADFELEKMDCLASLAMTG